MTVPSASQRATTSPFLKFALRADDAGGQQAAPFFEDGPAGAVVELNAAADLGREAEPAFEGADALALRRRTTCRPCRRP